jgi:hypothetical protein
MAAGGKLQSREAVRRLPQGFTRDDSPDEDECGDAEVWTESKLAGREIWKSCKLGLNWASLVAPKPSPY